MRVLMEDGKRLNTVADCETVRSYLRKEVDERSSGLWDSAQLVKKRKFMRGVAFDSTLLIIRGAV